MNQLTTVRSSNAMAVFDFNKSLASLPEQQIASIKRSLSLAMVCFDKMQLATQKIEQQIQIWEQETQEIVQQSQERIQSSELLLSNIHEQEYDHQEHTRQSIESIKETHLETEKFLNTCLEGRKNQLTSLNSSMEAEQAKIARQDKEIQKLKTALSNL